MPYRESSVRPATPQDAHAIALVHVESSRTTYEGIFSESSIAAFPYRKRYWWNEALTKPEPLSVTLVGCDESERVVGFVSGGAERTGRLGCDAEIYAMYLLQEAQRQGLGSLLVRRLSRELQSFGFTSMAVWVLARNPSRNFYEAFGGKVIAEEELERDGNLFLKIAYGWNDLSKFRA